MTTILTVDSGKDAGWALFSAGVLVACGLDPVKALAMFSKVDQLVVERPHAGNARASKRDLITLAIRAGEAGGVLGHVLGVKPQYIEPQQWKGSQTKEISHNIVKAKLTEVEHKVLKQAQLSKSKEHNTLDAIGIGLYVCRR